jgi:hypothetical protein
MSRTDLQILNSTVINLFPATIIVCPNCGFKETQTLHSQQGTVIIDPWQQLADLEAEMTRIQDQFEQRRAVINRRINARVPLLQLPPEITSEIFSIIYLADYSWDRIRRSSISSISKTPLLFGQICRVWREIAWSTPGLWCSLQLDLDQHKTDPLLLDQWLGRSCWLPLYICVSLADEEYDPSLAAIMESVAVHSERWRNIYFILPSYCYNYLER